MYVKKKFNPEQIHINVRRSYVVANVSRNGIYCQRDPKKAIDLRFYALAS